MIELTKLLLALLCFASCAAPCAGKVKIDVFKIAESGTTKELRQAVSKGAKFNVERDLGDKEVDFDSESLLFDYGDTPLHHAAMYNHNPQSIAFLISQGLDVEAKASSGNTVLENPLSCAVRNKNVEAVKALLEGGANPNSYSAVGNSAGTSFHVIAIEYKDDHSVAKSIIEALIKAGGDVNAHLKLNSEQKMSLTQDEEEFTAYRTIFLPRSRWTSDDPLGNVRNFSHAATSNLLATLTPLMYAVLYDNPDMVNILLDVNANPNIRSGDNKTALDYANELPKSSKIKQSKAFERLIAASSASSRYSVSEAPVQNLADEKKALIHVKGRASFPKMYPIERTE